jgi:transposase-like protein
MSMTVCLARTHDRVNASVKDWLRAWQNPESVGRRKKEPHGEENEMHLVVEHEE